ncbi:MAG: hypothetical protein MJZ86_07120 [Bacteroidales bacterium]|nr:hypothetical protein [Bacteroidales bacterium]
MKRVFYTISTIAMMAFSLTSCQKDEKVITHFTASLEQSDGQEGKIHLDGHILKWNGGEKVLVFSSNNTYRRSFTVTPNADDATFADLSSPLGIYASAPYTAIYPLTIGTLSRTSVELPNIQHTPDGSLCEFPMYAQSDNTIFRFKNLCGAIRVRLQQNGVSIKKIEVKANNVCGSFNIIDYPESPCVNANSSHASAGNSVKLICQNAQSIDEQHDFYIYLPVGTYNTMELDIYDNQGGVCTKTGHNIVVQRSKVSTVTCGTLEFEEPTLPDGCLPGTFSVSETKEVRFSKGNLQYTTVGTHTTATGTSPGTWRFAEHQYDFVGNGAVGNVYKDGIKCNNENISSNYTGWIDLFCWATSGWDCGNIHYQPYNYEGGSRNQGYGYGPLEGIYANIDLLVGSYKYSDWGQFNAISNGGNQPNVWRTLNKTEWSYLMSSRGGNTPTINGHAHCFSADVKVNGIPGILIFPDAFVWPNNVTNIPSRFNHKIPVDINREDYDFDDPEYDNWNGIDYNISEFQILQAAGCVFLPAAGYRYWQNFYRGNTLGQYASSEAWSREYQYSFYFEDFGQTIFYYGNERNVGQSVRLVQDIN